MLLSDLEVRFHHLKLAGTKSPAHLRALLERDRGRSSSAMEKGSAVHALVLGGAPVTFYPGPVRRGKKWEKFRDEQPAGTLVLSRDDYDAAHGMAEAVARHADAVALLGGERERTLRWKELGVSCRATPDATVYASHVTELKTCESAEPGQFQRQAIRYGYHAQLAWYRQAVEALKLGKPSEAYVVAVESSDPYPVTVLRVTERAMDAGARLVCLWFERLRACLEADEWPAYVQNIVDLDVPDLDTFALDFGEAA